MGVKITEGVRILTHGYDWSVLNGVYGNIMGSAGKVSIGNNCFIGMNSIILKGVTIGDNCIIGAGSLVNKDIPTNTVVAGNPARPISSIEDYYKKRLEAQLDEALTIYREYVAVYNKEPDKSIFDEFFFLFEERYKDGFDCTAFETKMHLNGNYEKALLAYNSYNRPFNNFNEFIEYSKFKMKE